MLLQFCSFWIQKFNLKGQEHEIEFLGIGFVFDGPVYAVYLFTIPIIDGPVYTVYLLTVHVIDGPVYEVYLPSHCAYH